MDSMYLDNLDECVNDERKIVTYKWLSLTLGVHTNVAKQMLYHFVQEQRLKDSHDLTVNYIVSGVVAGQAGQPDTIKVAVVPEDNLAAVKSEMKEVMSVHVYSVQRARLTDLSLLYTSHYDMVKEHIYDINKHSGIKCVGAELRSSADLEKLKKGSAYQPPEEPPRPESKYKAQVKKEPMEQDSKPVQSVNKVGSKKSGGKNNQIASMFAQQAKKVVKKEKTEDEDELAKPKEETKNQAKNKGGISAFLSKGPSVKKQQPEKETKAESSSSSPTKMKDSPRKSPAKDVVEEDTRDKGKVEEEETKIQVDSRVKKQSKIKVKKTNQTNKRKSEGEVAPKTKRKRIMELSDSESSADEDENAEAEWAALSPTPPAASPPSTLDTARIESDSEEEVPPTPQAGKNGRARKRKLVDKTYMDEEAGYLVTKKEYEYVDDSGEEGAADTTTTTTTTSESPGASQISSTSTAKSSPKKSPGSPQKKTKDSPKKKTGARSSKKSHTNDKKKQSNITSFFMKK